MTKPKQYDELIQFCNSKLEYYKELLQNTIQSSQLYKHNAIYGSSEINQCIQQIEQVYSSICEIETIIQTQTTHDDAIFDVILSKLQIINNDFFTIFKHYGTKNIQDLLYVCFGNEYIQTIKQRKFDTLSIKKLDTNLYNETIQLLTEKYDLIQKYCHPYAFHLVSWKDKEKDKTKENDEELDTSTTVSGTSASSSSSSSIIRSQKYSLQNFQPNDYDIFECVDTSIFTKNFYIKVYGIQIIFHKPSDHKSLIVDCIVDDILLNCYHHPYLERKIRILTKQHPMDALFSSPEYLLYIQMLGLKDVLLYSCEYMFQRFAGYISQLHTIKKKSISQTIKEFMANDLYDQRNTLILLLLKDDNPEYQYMAYLLYDLLSNDDKNGNIDTKEQTIMYDTFPWVIKKIFKKAMENTVQYTKQLSNFDMSKIPLEQQICLMNVNDAVKEKAMQKLKEVKSKSEDNGSKARQYLDGLLKIPFGVYKEEQILQIIPECLSMFRDFIHWIYNNIENVSYNVDTEQISNHKPMTFYDTLKKMVDTLNIPKKDTYSSMEVSYYMNSIQQYIQYIDKEFQTKNHIDIYFTLTNQKRNDIVNTIISLNSIIKELNTYLRKHKQLPSSTQTDIQPIEKIQKLIHSGKKTEFMKQQLYTFLETYKHNPYILQKIQQQFIHLFNQSNNQVNSILSWNLKQNSDFIQKFSSIETGWNSLQNTMTSIRDTLDSCVYGHEKAKRQLERVIGQWMSGEQTGYCFGFEGPAGVGKTTLAKKGLANCLKDNDGNSRPFGFIAIGGSSNGSTLEGHNYTYVGSTWGRIVDILMDSKCMNPIIFIDELDKVSKTEHGKEIIGILTHLVDTTQNNEFQDKYFSGIHIDVSKALFIFSYNDASLIDRILLDRIHRIQFEPLSIREKITITQKHLLPEIYKKVGLQTMIDIDEECIRYIIEHYTNESGVRKLKEVLFEIISEINLKILGNCLNDEIKTSVQQVFPYKLTKDNLCNTYLKDRNEIRYTKIHSNAEVGIMNGLWANAIGQGGVIPIQAMYFPTHNFLDMKLTGLQGDVMKESMNVAKSLAFFLTKPDIRNKLMDEFKTTQMQGLHIHCPEGAIQKDGPSAGAAITVAIYSLLNNLPIPNTIGMTGEINLQGQITAIGGLELKILGGIKAGVKHFLFPRENERDYTKFVKKYKDDKENILDGIQFTMVESIREVLDIVFNKNGDIFDIYNY